MCTTFHAVTLDSALIAFFVIKNKSRGGFLNCCQEAKASTHANVFFSCHPMVEHKFDPYENNDMSSASAPSVDELEPLPEQLTIAPPTYRAGVESNEQSLYTSSLNPPTHPAFSAFNTAQVPSEEEDSHDDDVEVPLLGSTVGDVQVDPFRDLPPPPQYSPYRATYKQKGKGVVSRDGHINEDGEALYRFLLDHNSPPAMEIKVHGIVIFL
jgi:hypothetical protein